MKIGYPCINTSISCKGDRTFRLKSYSEQRLIKTVENNLNCLADMLKFNVKHNILFFRITSDLVPFASHPICQFNWQDFFKKKFTEIGDFIKANDIRISMHPDQFTIINSLDMRIFENSSRELTYHAQILDSMRLDATAKTQIHVGGCYGNKDRSMKRFVKRFGELEKNVRRRLVIENDDRLYTIKDCMKISSETEIPVLFDVFHHEINNHKETIAEVFELFHGTWKASDGLPMVDYSTPKTGEQKGRHAESIELQHFKRFLAETRPFDFDIMLEIRNKEKSALRAVKTALRDQRFICKHMEDKKSVRAA